MTLAYIGIGSNLEEPQAQVSRAFDELGGLPRTRLAAIRAAQEAGATLDEIGVALGCSRQAVHGFIRYHGSDEQ